MGDLDRLRELQETLLDAQRAEDAAVIALNAYTEGGGDNAQKFGELMNATSAAHDVTAAIFAEWKIESDRIFNAI